MNKSIKRICVISQGYPTSKQPWFTFLDALLEAFGKCNVECTVISPQRITKCLFKPSYFRKYKWIREVENGKDITVIQPYYFSFSNISKKLERKAEQIFADKVIRAFEKLADKEFDAIYGHFWFCGLIAAQIGKTYDIPAFVACGESEIDYSSLTDKIKFKENVSGVICVSSKSKNECVNLGLCQESICGVFPNAINDKLFSSFDRDLCRKKLGISNDKFVVCFVGSFNERKGPLRVSAALDRFSDVYSIFIGNGSEKPNCKNIIFIGALDHNKIPEYLCAADVFVLPTLNEGCCNAIIEAMACGLPIISSNKEFNYDILDNSNSILIDPLDIDALENAIKELKSNTIRREQMGIASLTKASELKIDSRARNILNFMEYRCI